MSDKLRILITGFGPFPGAPFNPTQPLVARLLRLRRPALDDVELSGHIFPVTYQAVDRELPQRPSLSGWSVLRDALRSMPARHRDPWRSTRG